MAGSKVSNFAIGDSNIQSVMLTLDKTFKGQHQVSLTNYDTTAESQVAAGSVIEIGGALYKFDSNESITGTPSDGTVYIMAVPSGDSVTCAYTNTAPTWSDSKQGWYGTGGTANNRYLEYIMVKESSLWHKKTTFNKREVRSYARAYVASDQTASSSIVALNLTEEFDTNSEFSSNTYTARKPGYYLLNSCVFSNPTAGTISVKFMFYKNTTRYSTLSVFAQNTGFFRHSGSAVVFLDAGDEITLRIVQSSGNTTIIKAGTDETFIEIIEI